jgi:hypothetical protein
METPAPTQRPKGLTRLCIASFINQGVMFPLYLLGIPISAMIRSMDHDALDTLVRQQYEPYFDEAQVEQFLSYSTLLREHGVVLMAVLALRTLARFVGVLRMWRLKEDGFHIYTTAQLLGILLPMLVAGNTMFSFFGLMTAVLWCLLYWQQRRLIHEPPVNMPMTS